MNGLTIVETQALDLLISKVENMQEFITSISAELKEAKKPYLTVQEVMELTGFSIDWVNDHKKDIGYSKIGGAIRFKRKDVDAYIEQNYFKAKPARRY